MSGSKECRFIGGPFDGKLLAVPNGARQWFFEKVPGEIPFVAPEAAAPELKRCVIVYGRNPLYEYVFDYQGVWNP